MTPRLETIAETLFGEPADDDLKMCMSEILPAVQKLVDRGLPPNAIIRALAEATVATVDHRRH
jgi:hypothetical protein